MITLAAATSIAACGGGEDVHVFKVKGQVLGISASGQRVCLDTNANGRCEQGEPSALASESGEFSLQGPQADLLLEISASAPKSPLPAAATPSIVLRAPWQEPGVISFHSTSIKAVMETQGVDFAAARQQVAATLGVQPRDLSREFNPSGDEEVRTELARAAEDGLARIKRALAGIGAGTEVIAAVNEAARVDRHYQTKTMYRPQGDWKAHEAPPAGYEPVYTQLVARHGSRGLSSMKSDLAVYNMWLQAQADGGLTPLGEQLGPDLLKYMKAHFLLGYSVHNHFERRFDLTRAGIGEAAFALTCRSSPAFPARSPRIAGPNVCDLIGALCCTVSVLSSAWDLVMHLRYRQGEYSWNRNK